MNKTETQILGCFGIIALIIVSTMLNGWVLSILWGWFVVPVFGLPVLTIVQAIGLAMIVNFLSNRTTSKSDDNDIIAALVSSLLYPVISLIIGWVLLGFM